MTGQSTSAMVRELNTNTDQIGYLKMSHKYLITTPKIHRMAVSATLGPLLLLFCVCMLADDQSI